MQKILIVGGGLAGSCLSWQLIQKGCNITLIDSGKNDSSRIAAGIINPIVFRRMTKSWRVDEFNPYAKEFYQNIEKNLSTSFFHSIVIRRFFSSEQERNFWLDRQDTEAFSNYMHQVSEEDQIAHPYANQFGSARVKDCFFINTNVFLDAIHSSFKILTEEFDYNKLNPVEGIYKDEVFDTIVFCEGYQSKNNPWFNYLPVDSTKGETLTIKSDDLSQEESLNRKCFSLHLGNGQFRIGATYVWHTDTTTITEEGKELLLDNLKYLTDKPFSIISQNAGIRPTTRDRRPLKGRHADFPKLAVFNGLGAKGFMMAPLLSKEMCDFLIDNKEISKECRIERVRK